MNYTQIDDERINMPSPNVTIPLANLDTGEHAEIYTLGPGKGINARLSALGFTPGAEISMIQNYQHGPLVVTIRGSRIALGRNEARKILVKRILK